MARSALETIGAGELLDVRPATMHDVVHRESNSA
jgi:hypothetical protein